MKRLLIIAALIGLAGSNGPRFTHPAQSPKDVAVNGAIKPKFVPPQPPLPAPNVLLPQFVVVTNTNHPPCWPNCTNVQVTRAWAGFTWQATNGRTFSTYLVVFSTNLGASYGGWTNIEEEIVPDGLTHTNGLPFDSKAPMKFYRLYCF